MKKSKIDQDAKFYAENLAELSHLLVKIAFVINRNTNATKIRLDPENDVVKVKFRATVKNENKDRRCSE